MVGTRTNLDAATVINIMANHMIEQMDHLCAKNKDIKYPMSNSQFLAYECDHSAYVSIMCELAFLQGLSRGITEVPDIKPFPSPL